MYDILIVSLFSNIPEQILLIYTAGNFLGSPIVGQRLIKSGIFAGLCLTLYRVLAGDGPHIILLLITLVILLKWLTNSKWWQAILVTFFLSILSALGEGVLALSIISFTSLQIQDIMSNPFQIVFWAWVGKVFLIAAAIYSARRYKTRSVSTVFRFDFLRDRSRIYIIWFICGVLVLINALAIIGYFYFGNPSGGNTAPILFTGILTLIVLAIASLLFSFGMLHLKRQADLERRYRQALEEAHHGTLLALTSVLDLRDGEMYGHARRVLGYCQALGKRLGLDPEKMTILSWGALLHDIGKLGIPDSILYKPGPLTEEEWQQMRQHVIIGQQFVQSIPFLSGTANLVRHHHERFDGKGYPDGLAGDDIPLEARIFAVADTLDSLTSVRPYREEPMTMEEALDIIKQERGKQFCPLVVDALLTIPVQDLIEIQQQSYRPLDDLSDFFADRDVLTGVILSSQTDILTGTYNRAAWHAKASQMMFITGEQLGTVVFFDLNSLKMINDFNGHATGDRVLADFGARLLTLDAEIYRIGGDEFILWLPCGAWNELFEARMRDTLEKFTHYWQHLTPQPSVSWGVSTATAQTMSLEELVHQADQNMYVNKEAANRATREALERDQSRKAGGAS